MHEGELAVDDRLAERLLAESFPALRERELRRVASTGTVNTILRICTDLVARFPLLPASETELRAESDALAELAAAVPFPAPRPVGIAPPSSEYPSAWSVQTWIDGEVADPVRLSDSEALAGDLSRLIIALRNVPVRQRTFEGRGRGGELGDHDAWIDECLSRSGHLLDVDRAAALWRMVRHTPSARVDVMSHRDLTPFNLLVAERQGQTRLAGVLDGGGFGPADPALDLVCAWHLFDAPARHVLRSGVGSDDSEWLRGAGWAFAQAMGLGWYYEHSNPAMSAFGLSTLRRLFADEEFGAQR